MVFYPPSWVPHLPDPPDSVSIEEFMHSEKWGRRPLKTSRDPFTCGLSGKTYSATEVAKRVDYLSRAIAKRTGFQQNEGTEWDRVVGVFSVNTIDFVPFTHAVHRLNGIVSPANAAYSATELQHQLITSGAKALFTCTSLLPVALQAAKAVNIPEDRIFLLPLPGDEKLPKSKHATIDHLVEEGKKLEPFSRPKFVPGQGARQVAFLCFSSGTSGLPKAVMLSHRNVISNVLQLVSYENLARLEVGVETQTGLGILPLCHIYGLTLVGHAAHYRGDQIIILPRFELDSFLKAIQTFKIQMLSIVPPILISILNNKEKCRKYDLSSVRFMMSGAAPMGEESMAELARDYPTWRFAQSYGMTESSPLVTHSLESDILMGSSGSLVPGVRAKVIDAEGNEVTAYDTRGELLIQGPNVVLGYLNNEKANAETFVWDHDGRWLRSGDEVLVRKAPSGHEHFFVTDRIKELIKVKGFQVAPAELEAHLLTHPFVSDCTVIAIPDPYADEVPKAFVVKSKEATQSGKSDAELAQVIAKHVADHKARYKQLKGGVEFIAEVPKSPSGKILRRVLKDKEREKRKKQGAKL